MTDRLDNAASAAAPPTNGGDADASSELDLGKRCPGSTSIPARPASATPNDSAHFLTEPGSWFMLVPEGPIAILGAFLVPLRAAYLAYTGHIATAVLLMAGVIMFGIAAYQGLRNNEKWLTWIACVGLVAMVLFMGP